MRALKQPSFAIATALGAGLLAALLAASAPAFADAVVWEAPPRQYVALGARDGAPAGRNRHPFRVKAATLARALGRLGTTARGPLFFDDGDKRRPLFSRDTAARLGREMARAFRRAGPREDVLFQVEDSARLPGYVFKRRILTAGRAFRVGERLHIIFGAVHHVVEKRQGRTHRAAETPAAQGSRRAAAPATRPVHGPGVARRDARRADWIVIDLRKAGARQAPRASGGLDKRLARLQRLRRSGAISAEEYRARKKRLLDQP